MAAYFSSGLCGVLAFKAAASADGGMTATFSSGDEVLAYIGEKILTPTWVDPVCGDGNCEYPWEFPAYGPFGCQ